MSLVPPARPVVRCARPSAAARFRLVCLGVALAAAGAPALAGAAEDLGKSPEETTDLRKPYVMGVISIKTSSGPVLLDAGGCAGAGCPAFCAKQGWARFHCTAEGFKERRFLAAKLRDGPADGLACMVEKAGAQRVALAKRGQLLDMRPLTDVMMGCYNGAGLGATAVDTRPSPGDDGPAASWQTELWLSQAAGPERSGDEGVEGLCRQKAGSAEAYDGSDEGLASCWQGLSAAEKEPLLQACNRLDANPCLRTLDLVDLEGPRTRGSHLGALVLASHARTARLAAERVAVLAEPQAEAALGVVNYNILRIRHPEYLLAAARPHARAGTRVLVSAAVFLPDARRLHAELATRLPDSVEFLLDAVDELPHTEARLSLEAVCRRSTMAAAALGAELLRTFGGVGIVFSRQEPVPTVMNVQPGSPAARARISAGDKVLAIDGVPTSSETPVLSAYRLRGAPGSTARLTVRGLDAQVPRELALTRETLLMDTRIIAGLRALADLGPSARPALEFIRRAKGFLPEKDKGWADTAIAAATAGSRTPARVSGGEAGDSPFARQYQEAVGDGR